MAHSKERNVTIPNRELINDIGTKLAGVPSGRELNDELYPLVVAGDEAARERMIEVNMPLVTNKVDTFLAVFPHLEYLRDDLMSEGFIGLCIAVNKMAEGGPRQNANPTGFMSYKIHYQLGDLADKEAGTGAHPNTLRALRKAGKAAAQQVEADPDILPPATGDETIDPMAMTDLIDEIESCCEDENELEIVRLRAKGYVDQEIADQLHIPLTTTYMLRRGIYARFLEKSGMKGEV